MGVQLRSRRRESGSRRREEADRAMCAGLRLLTSAATTAGTAGVRACEFGRRLAARTVSGRDACGTLAQPYVAQTLTSFHAPLRSATGPRSQRPRITSESRNWGEHTRPRVWLDAPPHPASGRAHPLWKLRTISCRAGFPRGRGKPHPRAGALPGEHTRPRVSPDAPSHPASGSAHTTWKLRTISCHPGFPRGRGKQHPRAGALPRVRSSGSRT